jgi:hypothetical protein
MLNQNTYPNPGTNSKNLPIHPTQFATLEIEK